MRFDSKDIKTTRRPDRFTLTLSAPLSDDIAKLEDGECYVVEIKKKRRKRSLNANGYAWALCQEIAETLSRGGGFFSKEDIYRTAIQASGRFTSVLVLEEAVEALRRHWEGQGLGWIADEGGTRNGQTLMQLYHGSSSYDTEEMGRLIDSLVDWCHDLGIPTEDDIALAALLDDWRDKHAPE